MTPFDELTPPYSTIVVDPPWEQPGGGTAFSTITRGAYASMTLDEIKSLPVGELTVDGRCFLWSTNNQLRHGWDVLEAWGFETTGRTLVWCKKPRATVPVTTEFVLMGRKGNPPRLPWHGTTWFDWPRPTMHSAKPPAFGDLVESWCPGPYVELFARQPRLGWDAWGHGYELGETA